MKKLIKPLDLLLVAVLLLLSAGFFLFKQRSTVGAVAVITIDGEEYKRVSLGDVGESYKIVLPCLPEATLLVEKGAISFFEADCKDKVCVHTGKLRKRGDTAACLPAKVVVSIRSGEKNDIDALVY